MTVYTDDDVLEACRKARDAEDNSYNCRLYWEHNYVTVFAVRKLLPGYSEREPLGDRMKRLATEGRLTQLSFEEALEIGTFAILFIVPNIEESP